MGLPERLLERQKLQRSAREWLNILRQELNKSKPKGLGINMEPKSPFSPVNAKTKASGALGDGKYEIRTGADGVYEIIFDWSANGLGYIQALEYGVRGGRFQSPRKRGKGGTSSLFIESLKKWIKTKGIENDETKTTSLAFAIRRSIFNEGIAPMYLISEVNRIYGETYAEQIAKDYFANMENIIIENLQALEKRLNS